MVRPKAEYGGEYRNKLISKLQSTRYKLLTEVLIKIKFLSDAIFRCVNRRRFGESCYLLVKVMTKY
jgi:hypothetical protein